MKVKLSTEINISDYLDSVLSGVKYACFYAFVFSFFINLLMLTAPIYMLQVFDRVILAKSIDTLIYITIIATGALLLYAFLEIIRSYIMLKTANWFASSLSGPALLPCDEELIKGNTYGSQCIRDIGQIKQFISSPSTFSFFDVPWTPFYLALVFMIHPILGWISTVGGLIIIFLAILNEFISRHPIKDSNNIATNNNQRLDIAFRNVDVIKAFGIMPNLINIWNHDEIRVSALQAKAKRRSNVLTFLSRYIRYIMQILMLGAGAYLVIELEITPGMMIASSVVMSRALSPIEQLIGTWNSLVLARLAYSRLQEHLLGSFYPEQHTELPPPNGKLTVTNLAYAPPHAQEMILKHLNFNLEPGEMLSIIGPSAAGKTTLARVLVGILRSSLGEVRLDGVEISDWDHTQLGPNIGYLPQSIELFPDTVASNIARLQEGGDELIIKAAQLAKAHEIILTLPHGYDTVLGRDCKLSGGQQQRIALARALYNSPKYIVLDEPHVHLDIKGENDLIETLQTLKQQKCTIICIAYNPNIIKLSDKLLIIESGELRCFGPTTEVLQKLQNPGVKQ